MDEKLLLESHSKVKSNIIRISFDRKSEKVDLKFNFKLYQVLESQPELSAHDENLDCSAWCEEFIMCFKELCYIFMSEDDGTILELIRSFIRDQNWDEINQLDDGLLIWIHLTVLDFDKLVADVFSDMKIDVILEHVLNHLVIFGF